MPPLSLQSPRNEARAAAIAEALLPLDFDVICLEKAFDNEARGILEDRLRGEYPHRFGPANSGPALRVNSGVYVLSRIPLGGYREIEFRDHIGVEGLARKGAMLLSGEVAGRRFSLVATHLQGDDGPEFLPAHQEIRDRQMAQIKDELLAPLADAGAPLFICGDLSTPRLEPGAPKREGEAYRRMLRTFEAENGPDHRITLDDRRAKNDLARHDSGRTDEMDYILVRKNGHDLQVSWERLILRREGWDGPQGRADLSYRYAVGATIAWSTTAR